MTLRASAEAIHAFAEVFGDAVRPAVDAAGPADDEGWRTLTLTFENTRAACHRLLGFGSTVEILRPAAVRRLVVATAEATVRFYSRQETAPGPRIALV